MMPGDPVTNISSGVSSNTSEELQRRSNRVFFVTAADSEPSSEKVLSGTELPIDALVEANEALAKHLEDIVLLLETGFDIELGR